MIAIVTALGLFITWAEEGTPIKGVRRISVPQRHGPSSKRLTSQVIDTQEKFNSFIAPFNLKNPFEKGGGKDEYPPFAKTLMDAKIDFSKETLLLLYHIEPSGSIQVRLWLGEDSDGTLQAKFYRYEPIGQTTDVAHHCFALTVSKEKARRIVFWEISQRGSLELPLKK